MSLKLFAGKFCSSVAVSLRKLGSKDFYKRLFSARKNRIWLIVCGSLVVLSITGEVVVRHFMDPKVAFQKDLQPISTAAPQESAQPVAPNQTSNPKAEATPPGYQFDQNVVNILMLGMDSNQDRVDEGMNFRTDTIILVSIHLDTNQVSMISIPRDTYLWIGDRYNRINAAFTYGGGLEGKGFQRSMDTVSRFLDGAPIHYYVGFDMELVKQLVDSIGGIDYNVDTDIDVDDVVLHPGMQHLNGNQVLQYCRQRHGSSDFERIKRQQKMLVALFDQMKQTNQLKNALTIFDTLKSNLYTNLDTNQIASLGWMARNIDAANIKTASIEGSGTVINGMDVVIANQKQKKAVVKEFLGIDEQASKSGDKS